MVGFSYTEDREHCHGIGILSVVDLLYCIRAVRHEHGKALGSSSHVSPPLGRALQSALFSLDRAGAVGLSQGNGGMVQSLDSSHGISLFDIVRFKNCWWLACGALLNYANKGTFASCLKTYARNNGHASQGQQVISDERHFHSLRTRPDTRRR